jgi:hypothetical protein
MAKLPETLSSHTDTAIQDLMGSPRDRLIDLWRDIIGPELPKGISIEFLRAALAHEVQLVQSGISTAKLDRSVKRAAKGAKGGSARGFGPVAPTPGMRLVREWNGSTQIVDVTEEGYVWDGSTYRSLSAVAREITGARWSGPRFFGLTSGAAP